MATGNIIMTNHEYGSLAVNQLYRSATEFNETEARDLLIKFYGDNWLTIKNRLENVKSVWDSWYADGINEFLKWDYDRRHRSERFKTKENLMAYINSDESKDFRDENLECMYEIKMFDIVPVPYWIEKYYKINDHNNYFVQYIDGYYEPKKYGDTITINGNIYEYVDSQPLSEEIEHQADDGGFVYEYRGYSFLRILKKLN
jgi:hypothetical protein